MENSEAARRLMCIYMYIYMYMSLQHWLVWSFSIAFFFVISNKEFQMPCIFFGKKS